MLKSPMSDMGLPQEKLNGIYRGVVEDNNDPLKAGRCKVRIFQIHSQSQTVEATDGISTDGLPWAQPVLGLIEGSTNKFGLWCVPLVGSHVFCFFEAGNPMQPRYFASAPAIQGGTPDFDTQSGEYPHNIVLHVHGGHIIEIDSTPSNKRIRVYHNTGTEMIIDKDGNINITGVKNENKELSEKETINIGSDKSETVGGNSTLTISGNYNITVSGSATINVSGACNVKGNPINLNT